MPVNVSQQFYRHTPMIITMAREYCTNLKTDIAMNFGKRSISYFFVRFNNEHEIWYLEAASVASRRKFANHTYQVAVTGEGTWPEFEDNPISQDTMDMFIDM
jgi:hypothetical protein